MHDRIDRADEAESDDAGAPRRGQLVSTTATMNPTTTEKPKQTMPCPGSLACQAEGPLGSATMMADSGNRLAAAAANALAAAASLVVPCIC
jgi:hypothetical protein